MVIIVASCAAEAIPRFDVRRDVRSLGRRVPLAFFRALVLKLNIYQLYLLLGMEEVSKLILGMYRIKKGTWVNDLTELH